MAKPLTSVFNHINFFRSNSFKTGSEKQVFFNFRNTCFSSCFQIKATFLRINRIKGFAI